MSLKPQKTFLLSFWILTLAFSSEDSPTKKCKKIITLSPHSDQKLEAAELAYDKIINWMTKHKKIPTSIEMTSLGVNYGKFAGSGDYAEGGESHRSRLHNSPEEAFSRLLEKIESTNKLDILSEKEKTEIFLELKIRAGDENAFDQKIDRIKEESYEKIIQHILLHKKIPTSIEMTNLGVNYGKFAGIGDYFPGGESYRSRLHNSPKEAFLRLLEKIESGNRLSSLSEKEKTEVILELKIRAGQPNAYTEKLDRLRQSAYQKTLERIIEYKKVPAGFKEWNNVGVNYGKFVGGSDYAAGGESHGSRLHDGPPEAFQGLYYFAENSPLLENKPELRVEILKIIADRYQAALKRDKRRRQ